jgi:uncharacterized membrane protein
MCLCIVMFTIIHSFVGYLTAIFFLICAVGLGVLRPLIGPLYQPRMIGDGDCEEICGMKIGRGNRSTRRKPAPALLTAI